MIKHIGNYSRFCTQTLPIATRVTDVAYARKLEGGERNTEANGCNSGLLSVEVLWSYLQADCCKVRTAKTLGCQSDFPQTSKAL